MKEIKGTILRSPKVRLFSSLDVINSIALDLDLNRVSGLREIRDDNWPRLLAELYYQLHPLLIALTSKEYIAKLLRQVEKEGEKNQTFQSIRFDVAILYGSRETFEIGVPQKSKPTKLTTETLIFKLQKTLTLLCRQNFSDYAAQITEFMDEHFYNIRSLPVRVEWRAAYELTGLKYHFPELAIDEKHRGVDTLAWLTVLDFLKEHQNWVELLGKCPICYKLFAKPRKDAVYCGEACSSRARTKRYREKKKR